MGGILVLHFSIDITLFYIITIADITNTLPFHKAVHTHQLTIYVSTWIHAWAT